MAFQIEPANGVELSTGPADTSEASYEGTGQPMTVCPQIRQSYCNFYHWDEAEGKHEERPCTFAFVAEMAYQRHIFEMHKFTYDWMKKWYVIEEEKRGSRHVDGEVAGRLPRYPPDAGPSVIDRKAREDPVKMIHFLDSMFMSG